MARGHKNDGFIYLYRRLLDNPIMIDKPPLYLKVFLWMILTAEYQNRHRLKRGQLVTSIRDIQDAMSYKIGYRTATHSRKEIWGIIEWLRSPHEGDNRGTMIATTKVTHGFIITICNYDKWQRHDVSEGIGEANNEAHMKGTEWGQYTKNEKNERIYNKKKGSTRPKKRRFLNRVYLTQDEYDRLLVDYGVAVVDKYIRDLDEYIGMKQPGYHDHNLVIRNWIQKNIGEPVPRGGTPTLPAKPEPIKVTI